MIRIFVSSYNGYSSGILDGTWHDLPSDTLWNDIEESCVSGAEEFFISDYEAPFEVGELDNIDDINELAEEYENLTREECIIFEALCDDGQEPQEAIEHIDDCILYENMDMVDIAEEYVNSCYNLDDFALRYFDYEMLARDLEIDGRYIECGGDIVECCY